MEIALTCRYLKTLHRCLDIGSTVLLPGFAAPLGAADQSREIEFGIHLEKLHAQNIDHRPNLRQ